ncbi:MAG TPA: hypothetical protein VGJ20_12630 [Xanthobacteraceae bacterium]|jgi:hypothetical protein
MTFEQLIETVRGLQSEMTPEQAREATERLVGGLAVSLDMLALPATIDAGAVWAFAASGKPVAEHDIGRLCDGLSRLRRHHASIGARRPFRFPIRWG